MGVAEEAGKATGGFIDALRAEPLSLALVVMNLSLLVFFYVLLTAVAGQREREVSLLYSDHKEVRELLSKCVVPKSSALLTLPPPKIPWLQEIPINVRP